MLIRREDDFDRKILEGRDAALLHFMGAYEARWLREGAGYASIAREIRAGADLVEDMGMDAAVRAAVRANEAIFGAEGVDSYGLAVRGSSPWPPQAEAMAHPPEAIWHRGDPDLMNHGRRAAVIGSRAASAKGLALAGEVARSLAEAGIAVVSGLAAGIDGAAHRAALEAGGRAIAVIGTPIHKSYPFENRDLQRRIAEEHLLISHVPVLRHARAANPRDNAFFFPARNALMSAISDANVIVEAADRSGTLTQARAAVGQGRRIIVMGHCFGRGHEWPEALLAEGAVRADDPADVPALMESP